MTTAAQRSTERAAHCPQCRRPTTFHDDGVNEYAKCGECLYYSEISAWRQQVLAAEDDQAPRRRSSPQRDHLRLPMIAFGEDSRALPGAVMIDLSAVTPEPVRWLWPGRIPLGKLTVLDGDPGLGKSLITLDMASRVSQGRAMPDGSQGDLDGPANVLLLSAEDDPADTIRPRLDGAGADCTRIKLLDTVPDGEDGQRPITLADIEDLEAAIRQTAAVAVFVDPLMAYLSSKVDSHRDQDIRRVLRPLAQLAARTGVALVVVRHLNKGNAGNPLYRGGGSIGIVGAARSGLLVARDPDDASGEQVVLAVTKSNLARPAPALSYRVAERDGVPVVMWGGTVAHTASTLLAAPTGEERTALDEAITFLRAELAGGSRPVREVEQAARDAGVSVPTLRRAKDKIGVFAKKDGMSGPWRWHLPAEDDHQEPKVIKPERMITFGDDDHLRGDVGIPHIPLVTTTDTPCTAGPARHAAQRRAPRP